MALQEADLRGVDLRGANLRGSNLRRANLYEVDLREVDLREVDLQGAMNIEHAFVDQAQRAILGLTDDDTVTQLQQQIKHAEQAIQEKKELKRKIQQLEDNTLVRLPLFFPLIFPLIYLFQFAYLFDFECCLLIVVFFSLILSFLE
jgi:hypothetical protein